MSLKLHYGIQYVGAYLMRGSFAGDTIARATFEANFINDLSRSLHVHSSRIQVRAIEQGERHHSWLNVFGEHGSVAGAGAWQSMVPELALESSSPGHEVLKPGQAQDAGDTWYPQPAPADHPWRAMPRHALTIHYSGMTVEAQARIADGVREILDAHLAGEPLPDDYVVAAPQK